MAIKRHASSERHSPLSLGPASLRGFFFAAPRELLCCLVNLGIARFSRVGPVHCTGWITEAKRYCQLRLMRVAEREFFTSEMDIPRFNRW